MNEEAGGPSEALIVTRGVSKVYLRPGERVVALEDIDLEVKRNEYLAVCGASGSGKTTLLNVLGGLDRPTRGEVLLNGEPIGDMPEARLSWLRLTNIGFVFQDFCLVSGLSALDNVRLPLFLSGRLRRASERARDLLGAVGMSHRASHLPSELSRGEMQRIAIARALACDPELLLVDEPTANLDEASSASVRQIFLEVCRGREKTIVLATHDRDFASEADRALDLSYGKFRA